jgi:hypothetical protein
MTCAEFQRVLPDSSEGSWNSQQSAHLNSCTECSSLVAELNAISREARFLRDSEEPSARVWHSIASAIQEVESELQLIASEASTLQGSEEPSPRVWNSIATALQEENSELELIASAAASLQAIDEPSVRLWNSLEIALRQEGLIHQPQAPRPAIPFTQRLRWAWLVPVAATVVAGVLYLSNPSVRTVDAPRPEAVVQTPQSPEDQQVLEAVSKRTPTMRATYENNLKSVNAYIRDAEQSVKNDPNDEEAEQYLMDAYAQKAMVYEMALDRSLP